MNKTLLTFCLTFLSFTTFLFANESKNYWTKSTEAKESIIKVENAKYYLLSFDEIKNHLDNAPFENIGQGFTSEFKIDIPLPDGSFETFKIVRTRLMEPELAQKYPEIKTFSGYSTSTNLRRITLDYTYKGFHAMISYPGDKIFIDPISLNTKNEYICYTKSEFQKSNTSDYIEYGVIYPEKKEINLTPTTLPQRPIANELLTYRLAMATTAEYSQYHGGTNASVLSAVQTTVARVNEVYEVDLDVRLVLVNNTDNLFFFNSATDPYSNNSGGAMLGQNQIEVDNTIGSANYDIGHVFSTGGGGIASYASVCGNVKAQGVTGSFSPIGDPFDIDYVAHEIGHQFSGSHTFDGLSGSCGGVNRSASTAYEPGSGSTIMAYAGICGGDNIQNNSNDFFHIGSYIEMTNFIHTGFGRSCATITATGNQAPVVDANPTNSGYVIPMETPFELTGEATDPDGDDLTLIWEGYNRTGSGSSVNSPGANSALFRDWTPSEEGGYRVFPRLLNLLNNNTAKGETLPFSNRILNFRLTARDNRVAGGGVAFDEIEFEVTTNAGPFILIYPSDLNTSLEANDYNTITWDVAGTDQGLVNSPLVDIYLSTDNGLTFDILLADDVDNDGSHTVFLDNNLAGETNCRIKVKGSENIFFDLSNYKFKIDAFDGTTNPNPDDGSTSIINKNSTVFNIYPNPANEKIFISTNKLIKNISLNNILGQELVSTGNKSQIDISNYDNGIYFITVTFDDNTKRTERITKQ